MNLLRVLLVSLAVLRTAAHPNDEVCLSKLGSSLEDPMKSLVNWTKASFAAPCNGFTSSLSGVICNNGRVFKLSMSNMALQGSISPFLSNCSNLQSLDLSMNSLSGTIPPDLQYMVNLAVLNLSSNKLQEGIPPQLANCMYINVIDLHNNELSGQIPQELGLLVRLSTFDVSNNRLSGPIPASLGNRTGTFTKFNASSFEGNKKLYGYPLDSTTGKTLSVLAIVGIGLGSGLASLVISFVGVCIWLKYSDQKMARENGNVGQLVPNY